MWAHFDLDFNFGVDHSAVTYEYLLVALVVALHCENLQKHYTYIHTHTYIHSFWAACGFTIVFSH